MLIPNSRMFIIIMERRASGHCAPILYLAEHDFIHFCCRGSILDSVLFRVGILAGLRSKRLDGRTVGVMVTASHNPEQVIQLVFFLLYLY